jgi:hypothetical protein
MSGKYLLDTNIVIALFQGEQPILDKITQFKSVFTPSFVVGELYFGAFKSSKIKENVTRITALAALLRSSSYEVFSTTPAPVWPFPVMTGVQRKKWKPKLNQSRRFFYGILKRPEVKNDKLIGHKTHYLSQSKCSRTVEIHQRNP